MHRDAIVYKIWGEIKVRLLLHSGLSHVLTMFQHTTRIVPMLAPLQDKIVTWNVTNRFAAKEALRFLEEVYPFATETQLHSWPETPSCELGAVVDRWPWEAAFIRRWAHF